MYKIYSGDKFILISEKEIKNSSDRSRCIAYASAEELHKEYRQFIRSGKLDILNVIGEEKHSWNVFRSLFTFIEAAGGLVLSPSNELLMIYRNGRWDLPKGKMEKGEDPGQTAMREVEEECGVKHLKLISQVPSTYHIFRQDKMECIKCTYWFEMSSADRTRPKPQEEEGIEEAKWMKKQEVKKVFEKIYPSLQEVLLSTFSF